MFDQFLQERKRIELPIIENEVGTPFFTEEAPNETSDYLARLLRVIFNHIKLTKESFHRKHSDMGQRLGWSLKLTDQDRGNLRRALQRAEISWFVFEKAITAVLEYRILDLCITLQHPRTGKIIKVSLLGVQEEDHPQK